MTRPIVSVTAADEETARRHMRLLLRFPCAAACLGVWDRPWSGNAQRYAAHELLRAWNAGINVMELGSDRLALDSADKLVTVWSGDKTPRAYNAACHVLQMIGRLTGQEAEALEP